MQNKLHIYPTLTVLSYLEFREAYAMALLNHSSQEFINNKIELIHKDISYALKVNQRNTLYFLKYSKNILIYAKQIQLIFYHYTKAEQIYSILEKIEIQLTGKTFYDNIFKRYLFEIRTINSNEQLLQKQNDSLKNQPQSKTPNVMDSKRTISLSLNIIDQTIFEKLDKNIIKDENQKNMAQKVLMLLLISNFNVNFLSFKLNKVILTNLKIDQAIKNSNLIMLLDCQELELNNTELDISYPYFSFNEIRKLSLINNSEILPHENMFQNLNHLYAQNCNLTQVNQRFTDIETLEFKETVSNHKWQLDLGQKQGDQFQNIQSVIVDKGRTKVSIFQEVQEQLKKLYTLPKYYYSFNGDKNDFRSLLKMIKEWPEKCKYILQKVQSNNQNKEGNYSFTFKKKYYKEISIEDFNEYKLQMKQNKQNLQRTYLKSKFDCYSPISKEHFYKGSYSYKIKLTVTKYLDIQKYQSKQKAKKEQKQNLNNNKQ